MAKKSDTLNIMADGISDEGIDFENLDIFAVRGRNDNYDEDITDGKG